MSTASVDVGSHTFVSCWLRFVAPVSHSVCGQLRAQYRPAVTNLSVSRSNSSSYKPLNSSRLVATSSLPASLHTSCSTPLTPHSTPYSGTRGPDQSLPAHEQAHSEGGECRPPSWLSQWLHFTRGNNLMVVFAVSCRKRRLGDVPGDKGSSATSSEAFRGVYPVLGYLVPNSNRGGKAIRVLYLAATRHNACLWSIGSSLSYSFPEQHLFKAKLAKVALYQLLGLCPEFHMRQGSSESASQALESLGVVAIPDSPAGPTSTECTGRMVEIPQTWCSTPEDSTRVIPVEVVSELHKTVVRPVLFRDAVIKSYQRAGHKIRDLKTYSVWER
ncbi:hypothetical protein NMY22_g11290 [Coprinellus aureogranulatus]|nr:hypothetical protein NMY22_g11290 [Coprinellus aureogranulatus]